MTELICGEVASAIHKLADINTGVRAAVAFVETELSIVFNEGDVLVTDASDHAVLTGRTNASLLKRAFERNALLYSLAGLRSNILCVGGTAVIASGNVLHEPDKNFMDSAFISDDLSTVAMVNSLIHQLVMQAQVIDSQFIERISEIERSLSSHSKPAAQKVVNISVPSPRTWIVGIDFVPNSTEVEVSDTEEEFAMDSLSSWGSTLGRFMVARKSPFRTEAKVGDLVIPFYTNAATGESFGVCRHCPIVHRYEEQTHTTFFIEEFENRDETIISWSKFQKLLKKAGVNRAVGPSSEVEVSEAQSKALFSLWPT